MAKWCSVCQPLESVVGIPERAPAPIAGRCRGCYGECESLTPAGYCCSGCNQRGKSRRTNRRGATFTAFSVAEAVDWRTRDMAIVEARRTGKPLAALAAELGISAPRVRQIELRELDR